MEPWMVFVGLAAAGFAWLFAEQGRKIDHLTLENTKLRVALNTCTQDLQESQAQAATLSDECKRLTTHNDDLSKQLQNALNEIQKLENCQRNRDSSPSTPTSPEPTPHPLPDEVSSDPFHYFFNWLEDNAEYKKIYRKIEKSARNHNCLSCKQPVNVDECLPIHSHLYIHRYCYEELYHDLAPTSSEEEARRRFQEVPGKVSLLYWTLTHWPTYPQIGMLAESAPWNVPILNVRNVASARRFYIFIIKSPLQGAASIRQIIWFVCASIAMKKRMAVLFLLTQI